MKDRWGTAQSVGVVALLLATVAVVVAGVHDARRAQVHEHGRVWAASYYPKARAEVAAEDRRRRERELRAWEERRGRAGCGAGLLQPGCADTGGPLRTTFYAYLLTSCSQVAGREHPGWYEEDWRRGCEEGRHARR
ncbi:hypothetical protein [Streptomyces noursei]|uniref:hypothetical protein n=1 Tax=Streptomyces noursei TaxID=1971 RepID=UPI0023B866E2|nr:hypothetical protein [Streptomyces noursei]